MKSIWTRKPLCRLILRKKVIYRFPTCCVFIYWIWIKWFTIDVYSVPIVQSDVMISTMPSTAHVWWSKAEEHIQSTCLGRQYRVQAYPDVSVVLTLGPGEASFWVYHTLHALVKRTPPALLREIIVVDDNTDNGDLKADLQDYVETSFGDKVRIIRSNLSLGLSRARNEGFRAARGHVIAVIDSHVEVQERWLEPLLETIIEDPRTLASSYLDWIRRQGEIWTYEHGPSDHIAIFNWDFDFGFQKIHESFLKQRGDITSPLKSPSMPGGIFAIQNSFLKQIGYYDDGLQAWGGDNIDLPLKVWLSGGRVLLVPCSHIAHPEPARRAYKNNMAPLINRNYRRVADIYYGEYKSNSLTMLPELLNVQSGDITKTSNMIQHFPRNFSWFLNEVFPALGTPLQNAFANGGLRNLASGLCLAGWYQCLFYWECGNVDEHVRCSLGRPDHCKGLALAYYWDSTCAVYMTQCGSGTTNTDHFFLTLDGVLRLSLHVVIFDSVEVGSIGRLVGATKAQHLPNVNRWFHWKDGPMIESASGLCLGGYGRKLILQMCDHNSQAQRWTFKNYEQHLIDLNMVNPSHRSRTKQFSVHSEQVKEHWLRKDKRIALHQGKS